MSVTAMDREARSAPGARSPGCSYARRQRARPRRGLGRERRDDRAPNHRGRAAGAGASRATGDRVLLACAALAPASVALARKQLLRVGPRKGASLAMLGVAVLSVVILSARAAVAVGGTSLVPWAPAHGCGRRRRPPARRLPPPRSAPGPVAGDRRDNGRHRGMRPARRSSRELLPTVAVHTRAAVAVRARRIDRRRGSWPSQIRIAVARTSRGDRRARADHDRPRRDRRERLPARQSDTTTTSSSAPSTRCATGIRCWSTRSLSTASGCSTHSQARSTQCRSHTEGCRSSSASRTRLEFALVYGVLRLACRSQLVAVIGLAVALVANLVVPLPPYIAYPSTGPLRFGLPWVVIFAGTLRADRRASASSSTRQCCSTVGVAAVWSAETFVYSLAAYAAIRCSLRRTGHRAESARRQASRRRNRRRVPVAWSDERPGTRDRR